MRPGLVLQILRGYVYEEYEQDFGNVPIQPPRQCDDKLRYVHPMGRQRNTRNQRGNKQRKTFGCLFLHNITKTTDYGNSQSRQIHQGKT